MVGMEEWLYQDLESGAFHRSFTPELADKLAALYGIPVEDILDDYTLFLHRGGGAFLRRYREAKGWNRQQLADHAKVGRTSIRCWETGQKTISQKCFRLLAEKSWARFSFYAAHVRYGNFSPAKQKARLQATICGSADGLSLWNHSVSIILIFALTYMAFRKTRSRSSNVAFHAGCSENTVCST